MIFKKRFQDVIKNFALNMLFVSCCVIASSHLQIRFTLLHTAKQHPYSSHLSLSLTRHALLNLPFLACVVPMLPWVHLHTVCYTVRTHYQY